MIVLSIPMWLTSTQGPASFFVGNGSGTPTLLMAVGLMIPSFGLPTLDVMYLCRCNACRRHLSILVRLYDDPHVEIEPCPCGGDFRPDANLYPDHPYAVSFGPPPPYVPDPRLEPKKTNGHATSDAATSIKVEMSDAVALNPKKNGHHVNCETCGDKRQFVIASKKDGVRRIPCPDCT